MIVHLVLIQKGHFRFLSWMSLKWKTEKSCWTLMKRRLQKCRQMFWSILFSGLFLWIFDVLYSKFTLKITFLSRMSFDFCDISDLRWKFRSSFVAPFEISGALLLGLTRFWSTVILTIIEGQSEHRLNIGILRQFCCHNFRWFFVAKP